MKKIVLLAIVTYFLIAPFTYHPDTKLTLRYPALENGRVWDIYGYIENHKLDIPDFHYPISKIFGGKGFDAWLSSGSAQASFEVNTLRYNLAAKLPLLLLGLVSGWLIFLIVKKSTDSVDKGKLAAILWYFNPVTLYCVVMMGQNDIVAIFLFLLGILFYEKWWLTVLLWGVASGVKNYPIIWAIMFLLVWEKSIYKLFLKAISLVGVYGLILLPWLGKTYFIQAVLNSGLSQRMFIANIPIGFEKQIVVVPMLLIVVALNAWRGKIKNKMFLASLTIFQSCLVILGFSHFNPQWMLWAVPFLSIWWPIAGVNQYEMLAIFTIFIVWLGLVLGFDDRYITWGLFTPMSPGLINFPSLVEFVKNKGGSMIGFINLCQSVMAGVSIWFLSRQFKTKEYFCKNIKIGNRLIFIPWFFVMFLIIFLNIFAVENKTNSQTVGKEVYLNELIGKRWQYVVRYNLKYFDVSLDNPGLNSRDEGILTVIDNKGNKFEKEFSGYNAGANSWVRVDVPKSMSESNTITLELKDVVIADGLLKVRLDSDNRWAVNFYNWGKPSLGEMTSKLFVFWWWWVLVAGISVLYLKGKKD